ncbi:MAG: hypothetical protein IKM82_02395 [Oscillospiraceae bacterium]|nr:hypothetical protein [Oscillospiraceae bacterium]MBR6839424.1 hypothetical protein [Oscillospiraceae bacterium]
MRDSLKGSGYAVTIGGGRGLRLFHQSGGNSDNCIPLTAVWKITATVQFRFSPICISTHIKPALGRVKLCTLNPPQIQKFVNQLSKSGRKIVKKDKKTEKKKFPLLASRPNLSRMCTAFSLRPLALPLMLDS